MNLQTYDMGCWIWICEVCTIEGRLQTPMLWANFFNYGNEAPCGLQGCSSPNCRNPSCHRPLCARVDDFCQTQCQARLFREYAAGGGGWLVYSNQKDEDVRKGAWLCTHCGKYHDTDMNRSRCLNCNRVRWKNSLYVVRRG